MPRILGMYSHYNKKGTFFVTVLVTDVIIITIMTASDMCGLLTMCQTLYIVSLLFTTPLRGGEFIVPILQIKES